MQLSAREREFHGIPESTNARRELPQSVRRRPASPPCGPWRPAEIAAAWRLAGRIIASVRGGSVRADRGEPQHDPACPAAPRGGRTYPQGAHDARSAVVTTPSTRPSWIVESLDDIVAMVGDAGGAAAPGRCIRGGRARTDRARGETRARALGMRVAFDSYINQIKNGELVGISRKCPTTSR
jgi:hypothetical protein